MPSVRKLLATLKERINFPYGKTKLRQLLHDMGFKWKRSCSKRKVLVERNDIIDWRCSYLMKMKRYREEQQQIFFLDETWADSNITFRKCWQGPGVTGVAENISGTSRFIIVHIGSKDGFLPGAELIFKAGNTKGDYHGQMNSKNFSKWVKEKVIPGLPPQSVVIMDNAPYHLSLIHI